jgi:magnesium transporter
MDAIIDNYFIVMEQLGENLEALENEIIEAPSNEVSGKIHSLRRRVIILRRSIWPLREVISGLMQSSSELLSDSIGKYFRDLYDHTIQVIDTMKTYHDMLSSLLDIYLSSVSNRMNEVMKVLTIISTVFMPLSFLAGLYGMNFRHMPELELRWSYPALLGVMAIVLVSFIIFFKRKKWI